jgi:dipeptidase E
MDENIIEKERSDTKFLLFSEPKQDVLEKIVPELFIKDNMQIAYMPSNGQNISPKHESLWRSYIEENNSKMIVINNSLREAEAEKEASKLMNSDALILTGGNTFQFLNHLKLSHLDKAIINYAKMNKIIVGFSAGAMILSPNIELAKIPTLDVNLVGISDLSGLNLIKYDIYPHYVEDENESLIKDYEEKTHKVVKRLTNDDLFIIK